MTRQTRDVPNFEAFSPLAALRQLLPFGSMDAARPDGRMGSMESTGGTELGSKATLNWVWVGPGVLDLNCLVAEWDFLAPDF